jgi:tetratricopeptide (TPR) repeat protein
MLPTGPWRVFLSHTSDLREHPQDRSFVAAAEAAVLRTGHAVADMAYFAARDTEPATYCIDMVGKADIFVCIVGRRYGSQVPDRPDVSYTELEFEAATGMGLTRLIFVCEDVDPVEQSIEDHDRQEAFRQRLQDVGVTPAWVASPSELELRLLHALVELKTETKARGHPPEPRAGIPPDPAPQFIGREAELREVRKRLQQSGRVAVYGLGGVGKTQLVVRYLHEHRHEYADGIFWLRADQEVGLVNDLASLAWRLELPERDEREQEHQIDAVLRWLRGHSNWLVVVDNLEPAVATAIGNWLPPGLPGHVLLTSRTPTGPAPLRLEPMPIETARDFLLRQTGQVDADAANAVAETLGCLPLALVQAAAYVDASGRKLSSYLELLRYRLVELMAEGKPEDYPRTVTSTLQLSLDRLEAERPAAMLLLRLCAFLAPDDIPISVVQMHWSALPDDLQALVCDDVALDRAIAELRRYAVASRHDDAINLHRLVQAVIRESLPVDQRERWLGTAIRLLATAFPANVAESPSWPLCARLLPHVQTALSLVKSGMLEPDMTQCLLDGSAEYLRTRTEFPMGGPIWERVLDIRERVFGLDHAYCFLGADNMRVTDLLRDRDELSAFRPHAERGVEIREQVLGPDHPDTAQGLRNLAGLLWELHETAAPGLLYERALGILERAFGPDHPDVAQCINDLAMLLWDQGKLSMAQPLYERALDIRERLLGPDHSDTATSLNNLACLLKDQGKLAVAKPMYVRALAIFEGTLPWNHPSVAVSLNNLGLLLWSQGKLGEATSLYEQVLAICEIQLGSYHPVVAMTLNTLGGLLHEQDLPSGQPLLRRAVSISESAVGVDHPLTALSLDGLANILYDQGERMAARDLYERALDIRRRTLGPDHPYTAVSMDHFARVLQDEGDVATAVTLLAQSLTVKERALGGGHAWTVDTKRVLDEMMPLGADPQDVAGR